MHEPLTPELLRARVGVSQIPRPADQAAFLAAVKRHCPAALREQGRTGFVLVDVAVDATGAVEAVTAVPSPRGPPPAAVVARRDAYGGEVHATLGGIESDPELGPAAEAALREVRFTPALRDAVAVPFMVRIGIQFT